MSVCSGSGIVSDSTSASSESNRHSSTLVACSENRAKLTPTPSQVAPSGYGEPGQTRKCVLGTADLGITNACRLRRNAGITGRMSNRPDSQGSGNPVRLDVAAALGASCSTARSASRAPDIRFGLDPILGLIPGLGDISSPVFAALLLLHGVRMRVPKVVQARMVLNAAIDMLWGWCRSWATRRFRLEGEPAEPRPARAPRPPRRAALARRLPVRGDLRALLALIAITPVVLMSGCCRGGAV